ncbi:methyltransferase domain-containing protein [bacterium]|nr:methyltransferase domain-containing protein [bacterium]MBU1920633.1 methyltransferase domain-containing protein [bacterium]
MPGRRLFYTALGALFLRTWHAKKELKRIAKQRDKWDIYDAGSGYGQYTYMMGKYFPNASIHAVDVKEEEVEACNWFTQHVGQKNTEFIVGDLVTHRKPDSFDLALSVDVMEHILEDEEVFANVFASLRSGGLFLVLTPIANHAHEPVPEDASFSAIGEHVREGYTEEEFREKMARAGFVVEKMKRTYGPVFGKFAWWILQRIPMQLLTVSKLLAVLVIPLMILLYPFAALAMWLDTIVHNGKGGGWLLLAKKP